MTQEILRGRGARGQVFRSLRQVDATGEGPKPVDPTAPVDAERLLREIRELRELRGTVGHRRRDPRRPF